MVKAEGYEFLSVLVNIRKAIDFEKLFNYDEEKYLLVDKDEISMACKRLFNYCEIGSALVVELDGENITLKSENTAYGVDAEEVIPVSNIGVQNIRLGIDIRYLSGIINNISGDKVRLYLVSNKSPIYIIDDSHQNEKWGCALMILAK